MKKSRVIKYRWIVLSAMVMSGLLALLIALGVPLREGVTPAIVLVPLPILLVALVPVSIPKIVAHKWLVPISTTWGCSTIIAGHFISVWLMGVGHQCDGVVLTASGTLWCVSNTCWVASKLWRKRRPAPSQMVVDSRLVTVTS